MFVFLRDLSPKGQNYYTIFRVKLAGISVMKRFETFIRFLTVLKKESQSHPIVFRFKVQINRDAINLTSDKSG